MSRRCLLFLFVLTGAASPQSVRVVNGGFEEGGPAPAGWTLSGGAGGIAETAPGGGRCLEVAGTANDSNYWRSSPVEFEPGATYRLTFQARGLGQSQGTPVTGPVFANDDLGVIADTWKPYESIFRVPEAVGDDENWLRFGQWMANGRIQFDELALHRAEPLHRRDGELELGEGESLMGRQYRFAAPLTGPPGNDSRPLAAHRCHFNSTRWVFGGDSYVVYRHQLGGRRQTAANVEVTVGWYAGGRLTVEVGVDGRTWRPLGSIEELGAVRADIPAELLPAEAVWIRLRGEARERVGADADPGSFQVHAYAYEATVDGAPAELRGVTQYVAITETDPRLRVRFAGLSGGDPGEMALNLAVENTTTEPVDLFPAVLVNYTGAAMPGDTGREPLTARPGVTAVRMPIALDHPGRHPVMLHLGGDTSWWAETSFYVAELHAAHYGERLRDPAGVLGAWWCQSGWKISRTRPRPGAVGEALRISAARGEADAAQLVLRPTRAVSGLTAEPTALRGPGGATIPAAAVEVLRVGYVDVSQPTDSVGVAGAWPDPLPPLTGPLDLEADRNQPLWIRVTVPRGTAAGEYAGQIRLRAGRVRLDAPVRVRVFDFDLPERMTCETAFGFSPYEVWRYQGVTDPAQRRQVLEQYWRNFAAHHIAPYDPAPLDPIQIRWPNGDDWTGGVRDPAERAAGSASLRVVDDSPTGHASASSSRRAAIPGAGGLRLRFQYRAAAGHSFIVTFNHYDAGGQWMSGRNNDLPVRADGGWQSFDQAIDTFAEGAASVALTLWPCPWREDGLTTGTVWFDELSLTRAADGEVLLAGGFEPLGPEALVPTIDWTAWDAAMTRAIDEHDFNTFRMGIDGLGGGTFHSRIEPTLLGYAEGTPEYQAAMRAYLGQIEAHLAERGWLDEAFVYWFDEPDPKDYEFVMGGFRKLRDWAPRLRRMLTEQVEEALVGGPNLWCPISPEFNLDRAEERRAAGDQFWWYVCTGPKAPYATLFIDHPATELRVWLHQTWQRGIEGILVWQTNYWTSDAAYPDRPQNPYADPMGWVSGYSTPSGVRQAWGNGDGRFIYPPEAAADANPAAPVLAGPVDSLRWEMLRDGIEDYEYLVMLRDRLPAANLSAADRRRFEALLETPESISRSMTEFTGDPAPIEAYREALARALERVTR